MGRPVRARPVDMVVEVASNDGYLLQYARRAAFPCCGIEPTAGTAEAARAKGIEIVEEFFGARLAEELRRRAGGRSHGGQQRARPRARHQRFRLRLCAAAQARRGGDVRVPAPDAAGPAQPVRHRLSRALLVSFADRGRAIFDANGLAVFDVEEMPTHGGSLRVYAQRRTRGERRSSAAVGVLAAEEAAGLRTTAYYQGFQPRAEKAKNDFLAFLMEARAQGSRSPPTAPRRRATRC